MIETWVTFTLGWGVTYLTNVSIIVQFVIALVDLGVAIDYALLMTFRFRYEQRDGEDVDTEIATPRPTSAIRNWTMIETLVTFTLVWGLTYLTNVSIIVQFLIALVGLGVAIDYALLMIFRFRDELREGEDVDTAIVQTMTHAGRSVIVSGSTVAGGLLSLIVLPLPFIRSIGIGGMLIPAVSVLTAITLLPALLATLGTRINSLRVLPKRLVDRGHPEDGAWGRWARFVLRRPWPVAVTGIAIVATLLVPGLRLNPSEAQAKDLP